MKYLFEYIDCGKNINGFRPHCYYLDVGGTYAPGVIDHHHTIGSKSFPSTARMLFSLLSSQGQNLWPSARETWEQIENSARKEIESLKIILHKKPDFDALLSAFLLVHYISEHQLPVWSEELVWLADMADQGAFQDAIFERPNWYFVLSCLKKRVPPTDLAKDDWLRAAFFKELKYFSSAGVSSEAYLENRGFSEQIKKVFKKVEIGSVLDKLLIDVPIFDVSTAMISSKKAVWLQMDSMDMSYFEILKAKYRSSSGAVWLVFDSMGMQGKGRLTVSVDSSMEYALFGWGWGLESLEQETRKYLVCPDHPLRKGSVRSGYRGADPWYDGRGHGYTIVDSPISGTALVRPRGGRDWIISQLAGTNRQWLEWRLEAFLDILNQLARILLNSRKTVYDVDFLNLENIVGMKELIAIIFPSIISDLTVGGIIKARVLTALQTNKGLLEDCGADMNLLEFYG